MRLRSFSAATVADAMQLVRDALGPEAIILSTQRTGRDGVTVMAGVESANGTGAPLADGAESAIDTIDAVGAALEFHGLPPTIADQLLAAAADLLVDDPVMALAGALDARFSFMPVVEARTARPIMLVGPPGAGKTVTIAKLATRARLSDRPVTAVTCDTLRAGAVEQLATYARLLKIPAYRAKDPTVLERAIANAPKDGLLLVDTIGTNPFDKREMDALGEFIEVAKPDLLLVLPAGSDVAEARDYAAAYRALGATRLIATRVDAARRLGGVVAAAEAGKLHFAEIGMSPQIADGLQPVNPVSLARLILQSAGSADAGAAAGAHGATRSHR
ncbi:hypothetical protein [Rhodospirillaceae bacterium SYSU D60014]|uniref:flagellar biosynthesis protein FlhF n=1 Tax=Virgifigura deserti TaxID=2268457 RepID=UPI000E66DEE3